MAEVTREHLIAAHHVVEELRLVSRTNIEQVDSKDTIAQAIADAEQRGAERERAAVVKYTRAYSPIYTRAERKPVVQLTVGQLLDDELQARGGMTQALADGLSATFGVSAQLFLNLSLATELSAQTPPSQSVDKTIARMLPVVMAALEAVGRDQKRRNENSANRYTWAEVETSYNKLEKAVVAYREALKPPSPSVCSTCGGEGEIDAAVGGVPQVATAPCPDCVDMRPASPSPSVAEEPSCSRCGHADSDHPRAGHCGACVEDDGDSVRCSCPGFASPVDDEPAQPASWLTDGLRDVAKSPLKDQVAAHPSGHLPAQPAPGGTEDPKPGEHCLADIPWRNGERSGVDVCRLKRGHGGAHRAALLPRTHSPQPAPGGTERCECLPGWRALSPAGVHNPRCPLHPSAQEPDDPTPAEPQGRPEQAGDRPEYDPLLAAEGYIKSSEYGAALACVVDAIRERTDPPSAVNIAFLADVDQLRADIIKALETSGNEPMKWLARELRGLP